MVQTEHTQVFKCPRDVWHIGLEAWRLSNVSSAVNQFFRAQLEL